MARRDVSPPSVGEITPGVLLVIHRNLSSHFHLSEYETGLAKAVGDLIFWLLLARAQLTPFLNAPSLISISTMISAESFQ